jgi:hypothetical protein
LPSRRGGEFIFLRGDAGQVPVFRRFSRIDIAGYFGYGFLLIIKGKL